MADAARSSDYFLNATTGKFDDNSSGAITAQMLRDFAVSAYQPQMVNPGGRLTLTTATPVTTADVTAATSVYYTPYLHNCVGVYDGTSWKLYTFSELTLALGTLVSATNYDVFLWDNAGTLTLVAGPAWTSGTARGSGAGTTQLSLQDGVWVNTVAVSGGPAAKAGRYLGTFRTTATTTTEDSYGGASQSGGKRFVWNAYNRVLRPAGVIEATDSWTYTTATWRQANGNAGNQVAYVCGLVLDAVKATAQGFATNANVSSVAVAVGVGVNATNANSAKTFGAVAAGLTSSPLDPIFADYVGYPGLGSNTLAWLEYSTATSTTTWYGDNGGAILQAGLNAEVWA